jgi:hypothetical protein
MLSINVQKIKGHDIFYYILWNCQFNIRKEELIDILQSFVKLTNNFNEVNSCVYFRLTLIVWCASSTFLKVLFRSFTIQISEMLISTHITFSSTYF